MNFSTKINILFEQLQFTNIKVARYGKLDPSLISRFRTGNRIPSSGSKQIYKLSQGIVLAAQDSNKLTLLCSICNFPMDNPHKLKFKLETWFNEENSMLKAKRKAKSFSCDTTINSETYSAFPRKMDLLMNLFNITNVSLAKALHIDSSLVSRFRTGIRNPNSESWFPPQFCSCISEEIIKFPKETIEEKLAPLIGKYIPDTSKELREKLLEWMYHDFKFKDLYLFSELITKLENLNPMFKVPQKMIESIKNLPIYSTSSEVLIGQKGLKEAVTRFLVLTAMHSKPCTLYLYSSQSMDWLTADSDFSSIWSLLMYIILQNKNKICIVHNINRSFEDVEYALKKWIPLYMSGMVQSFVYTKELCSPFSNTMFIMPETCSITASFITGTEDKAKYYFTTTSNNVRYSHQQFEALLAQSKPLHKVYTLKTSDEYSRFISQLIYTNKVDVKEVSIMLPKNSPNYIMETIKKLNKSYNTNISINNLSEEPFKNLVLITFETKISLVINLKDSIIVFASDNHFFNKSLVEYIDKYKPVYNR